MDISNIIQLVVAIIVGAIGWNTRVMINQFEQTSLRLENKIDKMETYFIKHVTDRQAHGRG